MDREQLLATNSLLETQTTYSSDPNSNISVAVHNNGVTGSNTGRHQTRLSRTSRRKSIDLTSTFDITYAILGWQDINVFVHRRTSCFDRCCKRFRDNNEFEIRQILNGVNGEIPSRSLVAITGPRGAGKTTFLNVLAHRKIQHFEVSGTVFVNEEPVGIGIREISAYVEENDLFIGSLTVYEHLIFQAQLRMDKETTQEERRTRVDMIMEEFDLHDWANILIGMPGQQHRIPRGVMKCLSIASELLDNEKFLLFADDPLSGLDALSANILVEKLQRLTQSGYTVICTVDQPTSEVYAMFDRSIILAEGRIAFLGRTDEAVNYFGSIGFPCPSYFNPIDFFIRKLTVLPYEGVQSRERVTFICDKYLENEIYPRARSSLGPIESFEDPETKSKLFKAGRFNQFLVVLWRCFLTIKREKSAFFFRIIQATILGLIAGQVYFQLNKNQEDVRNFSGLLYFLVLNISFLSYQGVLFTFPMETNVFLRDNEKGIYCTSVYFLAKSLVEIPVYTVLTVILISISYWMAGLHATAEAFFLACCIGLLICHTAVSFGYLVTTATDSLSSAIAVGPIMMLPLLMFGGFFVSNNTVPVSLKWLKYLSWFNFGFENFMINQWRNVPQIEGCGKTTSKHCLQSGKEVLDFYQLDEDNFERNFWSLGILLMAYRIIAFVFLLSKTRKQR